MRCADFSQSTTSYIWVTVCDSSADGKTRWKTGTVGHVLPDVVNHIHQEQKKALKKKKELEDRKSET